MFNYIWGFIKNIRLKEKIDMFNYIWGFIKNIYIR